MKNSINHTVLIEKHVGETPLEVVTRYKQEYPEHINTPIAYAGRLDPMAHGQLLLLVGEACKERDKYLGLDKEYVFEVLLGFDSDTHDILGLVNRTTAQEDSADFDNEKLESILDGLRGEQDLLYPIFSSKTVQGKPLFLWTLEGRTDEIDIPTKSVSIYDLIHEDARMISKQELWSQVTGKIALVTPVVDPSKSLGNDFRRKEVLASWEHTLAENTQEHFCVLRFRCFCSSGTYMRTLARMIGAGLGVGGLAWDIHRTAIGYWDGEKINQNIL